MIDIIHSYAYSTGSRSNVDLNQLKIWSADLRPAGTPSIYYYPKNTFSLG